MKGLIVYRENDIPNNLVTWGGVKEQEMVPGIKKKLEQRYLNSQWESATKSKAEQMLSTKIYDLIFFSQTTIRDQELILSKSLSQPQVVNLTAEEYLRIMKKNSWLGIMKETFIK